MSLERELPFAMSGAVAPRPLTDEELERVAGGSATGHFPPEGGVIYDTD